MGIARFGLIGFAGASVVAIGFSPFLAEGGSKRPDPVLELLTPSVGTAGAHGWGTHVLMRLRLSDGKVDRRYGIQAQWGRDRDGDGAIEDDEFLAASMAGRDRRNTASVSRRGVRSYRSGDERGSEHGFVWDSMADAPEERILRQSSVRTPQGRFAPDADQPDFPVIETISPGVQLRFRATRGRRARPVSDWVTTSAFDLDNATRPFVMAGYETLGDRTTLYWDGVHPGSEDTNSNGNLDPGEDRDGDGELDLREVGISFDFRLFGPDEEYDLVTGELASAEWKPCTKRVDEGDPDFGKKVTWAFGPVGTNRFVWDAAGDGLQSGERFAVRARVYDAQSRVHGSWSYLPIQTQP